jgi:hypothetical protein
MNHKVELDTTFETLHSFHRCQGDKRGSRCPNKATCAARLNGMREYLCDIHRKREEVMSRERARLRKEAAEDDSERRVASELARVLSEATGIDLAPCTPTTVICAAKAMEGLHQRVVDLEGHLRSMLFRCGCGTRYEWQEGCPRCFDARKFLRGEHERSGADVVCER